MIAEVRCSDFIFNHLDKSQYRCNKISLNRVGNFVKSPDWLKNKNAINNSKHSMMKNVPNMQ